MRARSAQRSFAVIVFAITFTAVAFGQTAVKPSWMTHAHDAQHTGLSDIAGQDINRILWSIPVDLHPTLSGGELLVHYGSPLVTVSNTVIVPVKNGTAFQVDAVNGKTGKVKWLLKTDYTVPSASFTPSFGPVLSKNRLIMPAAGGTVLIRNLPDTATGTTTRAAFFGNANFNANPTAYINNVKINTPIAADASGNLYFGFVVTGSTPVNLQSGIARIARNGQGTWIAASTAANDTSIRKVSMNCSPAVSLDGKTIYVAVNSGDFGFGYLLALDSTTLQTIASVRLTDPASGMDATLTDESSATPTVGPDGDVYYGVLENPFPDHNDRGWLLHFSGDLKQTRIPGSFGWDDTASVVPASMVPSYIGTSKYLLMTKYNNYANVGGDGKNKIAILDPNKPMKDPILGNTVMKEVLTRKGVTPDPDFPNFPGAVREWCINAAVVDRFTKSVLANSEDGKLYRWDLTTNQFSQVITLTGGIGEAYTPTLIGSDGTVYAINDAVLFALGK